MPRAIDHLVLVAHDLDAQAAHYQALGFQVGAQNRHDWGTLNRIIQFNGCFLELLTTEEDFERPADAAAVAQFANVIDDYLDRREGFAMLVLASGDAVADQADFSSKGIAGREVFDFQRLGRRPNGETVTVAFSLAFARPDHPTHAGYFVCQQHAPELFWNPAFQKHPNTATGIAGVVFQTPAPDVSADFFSRFAGQPDRVAIPGGFRIEMKGGAIDCLEAAAVGDLFGEAATLPEDDSPGFAVVRFRVRDIACCREHFRANDIPFADRHGRSVVPAGRSHGVTLTFEA